MAEQPFPAAIPLSRMDKTMIEAHLKLSEDQVRRGAQHVATQREVIDGLERDGHATGRPRQLLQALEDMQALYIMKRDRMQQELKRVSVRRRKGLAPFVEEGPPATSGP